MSAALGTFTPGDVTFGEDDQETYGHTTMTTTIVTHSAVATSIQSTGSVLLTIGVA